MSDSKSILESLSLASPERARVRGGGACLTSSPSSSACIRLAKVSALILLKYSPLLYLTFTLSSSQLSAALVTVFPVSVIGRTLAYFLLSGGFLRDRSSPMLTFFILWLYIALARSPLVSTWCVRLC